MTDARTLQFKIHGMDCAEEVAVLKKAVGPLVGGEGALAFDILNARMAVNLPPDSSVSVAAITGAVKNTGMRAAPWHEGERSEAGSTRWERHGRTVLSVLSGLSLVAGFAAHAVLSGGIGQAFGSEGLGAVHEVPLMARLFYTAAILTGGWFVAPKAWLSIRRFSADMNLLMTIAVIGAVGIGEWFEAATVSFLFALSLALEAWSVGRARRAVEALMDLAPPVAHVIDGDGTRDVPPPDVAAGAAVRVKPGERVPVDGEVIRGSSDVNQAPITGESLPVTKEPGSAVFAGTINGSGVLDVRVTKNAVDTTLAHIIRMVGEASSRRAPAELWVERFARIYTPAIMLLALVVLLLPPIAFGAPWETWIYRSLVLLVIGCPCALVISTPVTIVAALASAARQGVLIKGGIFVEIPSRIRAIAFDKTGTLTRGTPEVKEVVTLGGHTELELLKLVTAMESQSNHPLARAIVVYAEARGIRPPAATAFQTLPGKGATGRIDEKTYWIGSHRYLEERGQETPDVHAQLESMAESGRSVVVIGDDTHVCGLIALADAVRPESAAVLATLQRLGVARTVMLTGDNQATARVVGDQIGVMEVRAELLPADKVTAVAALADQYGVVAMVGDGVNDAPALARATVGIAMGAAGSDAAIETADIALMSDDLAKLPWLIQQSRRAVKIIRQNIGLSLSVKAAFVVLTFTGTASLWAAIAADMGVSLLVIFNALRLLKGSGSAVVSSAPVPEVS